jgi:diguanylate cyclase (GGDEF)-like protein
MIPAVVPSNGSTPGGGDGTLTLLDAARVLARESGLDAKLASLSEHATRASGAMCSAFLLYDAESGTLSTPDGAHSIDPDAKDDALAAVIHDRRAGSTERKAARADIEAIAPAPNHAFLPLIVDEGSGAQVVGVLVLGLADGDPAGSAAEAVAAIADLAAVAIRQDRLSNALAERSSYEQRLAFTDALTGLANRSTFEQMLELELARSDRQKQAISVCLFSVERLDDLVATQGAAAADEVLRHVAATLAAEVRLIDTVARLTDREFGVIAPGNGGVAVAKRVLAALAQRQDLGVAGLAAGISSSVSDGSSGTELLAAARGALERARRQGPGTIITASEATPNPA